MPAAHDAPVCILSAPMNSLAISYSNLPLYTKNLSNLEHFLVIFVPCSWPGLHYFLLSSGNTGKYRPGVERGLRTVPTRPVDHNGKKNRKICDTLMAVRHSPPRKTNCHYGTPSICLGEECSEKKMTSNYTRRLFLDDDVKREHPHVRFYHLFRRRFMERLYCLMMSHTTTIVLSLLCCFSGVPAWRLM